MDFNLLRRKNFGFDQVCIALGRMNSLNKIYLIRKYNHRAKPQGYL